MSQTLLSTAGFPVVGTQTRTWGSRACIRGQKDVRPDGQSMKYRENWTSEQVEIQPASPGGQKHGDKVA